MLFAYLQVQDVDARAFAAPKGFDPAGETGAAMTECG